MYRLSNKIVLRRRAQWHAGRMFISSSRSSLVQSIRASPALSASHVDEVRHTSLDTTASTRSIPMEFKDCKGSLIKRLEANEGDHILDIAHQHGIDLEGACEGSLACSTCHIILPQTYYDTLPAPQDNENDMLDMAFGLTETSRLACQVKISMNLEGLTVTLPTATCNATLGHE
ncbi:2Fe-2S ferredoxin-type domain-containing protein [Rhodocollybia butyracea]|uniref:2Fe-2S ferredoxin-type domain-containing protein n=1 Tax=Rhodocollybia butyracea TaxID=206335 RepID=A0A9P5TW17_9AGAR|nr:2Fe-2S ferredoxin-type domain-containing protein [Rhodocollybia butyracea]